MIKILLADDEIEARDNIIQYIDWAANGLELVGAAGDGEEALRMILGCRPDIAILDIYMPKLSGIQVIERCREELPNPPAFIIVSGYNEFSYAQQAIRLKVEEYLLKPFPPRELMEAIQRALLHVEVSRGIANNDFISFVKDCQAEAPRASAGRYPVEGERRVLAAVSAGSAEDVKRSVDGFLAECLPGLPLSAALNYGEMLYFEICRLVMERSGSFPAGNVFFDRSWTRENACAQLSEETEEGGSLLTGLLQTLKQARKASPRLYEAGSRGALLLPVLDLGEGGAVLLPEGLFLSEREQALWEAEPTAAYRLLTGRGESFAFWLGEWPLILRRPLLSVERTEEGSFAVRLDCQTGPGSAAPTQEMLDRLGSVCSRLLAERWAAGQDLLGLGARQALALGPGAALDPAKNACPQLRTSVKVY